MRKEQLRAIYNKACEAQVDLEKARALIANLHYVMEEADNSKFLLENVGRWAAPSDDAHEILFERARRAEEELNKTLADGALDQIKACLQRVSVSSTSASDDL